MWAKTTLKLVDREKMTTAKNRIEKQFRILLDQEIEKLDEFMMILSAMKEKQDGHLTKKE